MPLKRLLKASRVADACSRHGPAVALLALCVAWAVAWMHLQDAILLDLHPLALMPRPEAPAQEMPAPLHTTPACEPGSHRPSP